MKEADRIEAATGSLLAAAGCAPLAELHVTDPQLILPSVFRLDVATASSVAAFTAAAAQVAQQRGGWLAEVGVNGRAAQISFRSERYLTVDGAPPVEPWAALSGDYRSADGWVRVHANFGHHAALAAKAMGVAAQRNALEAAIAERTAEDVESAILDAGGAAGAMRTMEQWAAHPQGRADRERPVLHFQRLDDAPAKRWSGATALPLNGLRVLDLTRVIAGPVCGRVLAARGADVLAVTAAHLAQIHALLPDVGLGKRSAFLDLRRPEDRRSFESLVADADVLVESFRPGALAALGYGPTELAAMSPGLVVVDLRAFGSGGPFEARRGFDSVLQLVCGLAHTAQVASGAERPVPLPCQALDHGTGWLGALGALGALLRQRREGGSWRVEVSLSATAAWLSALGRCDGLGLADPGAADVADLMVRTPSGFGSLTHVGLPGTLDDRPGGWAAPPPVLGSDSPRWSATT